MGRDVIAVFRGGNRRRKTGKVGWSLLILLRMMYTLLRAREDTDGLYAFRRNVGLSAWGSTQPRTEMRNLPGGKERPVPEAGNLTDICEPIVSKMWDPRRLTTLGPPRLVTGMGLHFYMQIIFVLHMKHLHGRPRSVTGIALLFYM
jgi:hypothetical protein